MKFEFEFKNEKKNLIIELRVRSLLLINIELKNKSKFYRSLYSINRYINRYVL